MGGYVDPPILPCLLFTTEAGNKSSPLEQGKDNACHGHNHDDLTESNTELERLDDAGL